MHLIPSGARFIIAGKKCINKLLSKHVTSAFKNKKKKKNITKKRKTFWVIQNDFFHLELLTKSTKEKHVKQISTFDFSTLYTKIPHENTNGI